MKHLLTINKNELKHTKQRFVKTTDGILFDIMDLLLAEEINLINIIENHIVPNKKYLTQKLNDKRESNELVYLLSHDSKGTSAYINEVNLIEENAKGKMYDANALEGPNGSIGLYMESKIDIPLYGYEFLQFMQMLHESKVIKWVTYYGFIILNKKSFFKLINKEIFTIEKFKEILNKKST